MTLKPASGLASLAALALALTGCAAQQRMRAQPDSYSLGRNSAGEPCTATRNWRDPIIADAFDQSWSIGCRNVAASRSLGSIRVLHAGENRDKIEAALNCGAARTVRLNGIGDVEARRCYDTLLSAPTVAFTARWGGRLMIVSAGEAVLGPAEEAARLIAGQAMASPMRAASSRRG